MSLISVSYHIQGIVERGSAQARTSGYPTANLALATSPLCPEGIYCGWTRIDGRGERIPSIIFYGIPYAIPEVRAPRFEVHLFEQIGDLCGKELAIELTEFVRGNKKFDNPEELQKAIENDIKHAKEYFKLSSSHRLPARLRRGESRTGSRPTPG